MWLWQFLKVHLWLLFFRLVAPTLRMVNDPDSILNPYIEQGKSLVFCGWHEITFIGFYWFRHRNASALIEGSNKGDVLAAVANYYGFKDFRITDNFKDSLTVRNTIGFIKFLRTGGHGVIALDGPNGPYRVAKPGCVQISKKTGALIIPTGVAYSRKLILRYRWDKYQLPLPFSKVALVVDKPIEVPPDLPQEQEQAKYDEIVAAVNKVMIEAEKVIGA